MVGGMVMVGAIVTNKSPVTLSQVTPIARLTGEYEVVVVPASSKLKTMKDLVAQFKANPGQRRVRRRLGRRHRPHPRGDDRAGGRARMPAKINYIAYAGGGEALAAILGGHVAAGISGYGEFAAQIKSGKMRALAISSDKRVPGIDIPTLKEQGIDVELVNWRGVFGAPGITDAQRKELIDARRRDGEVAGLAGDAQEERVGRPLRERRRVQGLSRRGHRARRPRSSRAWDSSRSDRTRGGEGGSMSVRGRAGELACSLGLLVIGRFVLVDTGNIPEGQSFSRRRAALLSVSSSARA